MTVLDGTMVRMSQACLKGGYYYIKTQNATGDLVKQADIAERQEPPRLLCFPEAIQPHPCVDIQQNSEGWSVHYSLFSTN